MLLKPRIEDLPVRCFRSPRNIYFGQGSLRHLETIKANKVFIVTDATIVGLGIANTVSAHLSKANIDFEVFSEVETEPSALSLKKGTEKMKSFHPDWIIGLGGGSCLDSAKAMWIFYEHPELSWKDFLNSKTNLKLRTKAGLITIPTTSGTGAEVSWCMVITDKAQKKKLEIAVPEVIADVVILDPELTTKMSPQLTADTGLDALAHALEAYVASLKNDFSDGLALQTARLVFKWLPKAYKNGDDLEAREHLHSAATIAGLSFGNSQVGLAHSLGHALGALFNIPHGRCVGIFLPLVIEYNAKCSKTAKRYVQQVLILQLGSTAEDLAEKVRDLTKKVGNPLAVKNLVEKKDFRKNLKALIERTELDLCTAANPIVPSRQDLRKIFECAYEGKQIDF